MRATHSVHDLSWNRSTDRKPTEKYSNNPREPVCTGTRVFIYTENDPDPAAGIYFLLYTTEAVALTGTGMKEGTPGIIIEFHTVKR